MTCSTCRPNGFTWQPIPVVVSDRIESVLGSMVGTPYQTNQRARGVGFDCRTAVAYFLEQVTRSEVTDLPAVPADSAVNHPAQAAKVLRALIRAFGVREVSGDKTLEPGDILGVRPERDHLRNPAHAYIVGQSPFSAYHAPFQGSSFCRSAITPSMRVVAVYRHPDKESWV